MLTHPSWCRKNPGDLMGIDHIYFSGKNGEITGHIALPFTDAVFTHGDQKVLMSFHPYLGPSFDLVTKEGPEPFYPGEEPKYNGIWDQFSGWWESKGKSVYNKKSSEDGRDKRSGIG